MIKHLAITLAIAAILAALFVNVHNAAAAEYSAGTRVSFEYESIHEIVVNGIDGSSHIEYELHGMLTFFGETEETVYVKVFSRDIPTTVDQYGFFRYDGQIVLNGIEHTYIEIPAPTMPYVVALPMVAAP